MIAQIVSKINDAKFKNQFGIQRQIQVGKLPRLTTAYPAIKSGATTFREIDKKQKWILLAALYYEVLVKL